jgi:hypothetical protein
MTLAALALVVAAAGVQAQPQPLPELDRPKAEKKDEPKEEKKPRPRISVKPKGGSIGDDVPGGGPRSAESSKGGTPGGPSGSFTGEPRKP